MARPISKAGGSRQRMWNVMRAASKPLSVGEIAKRAGCALQTAQGYLAGLKENEYVINNSPRGEGWLMIKNTGKRSPSINLNTGSFCDWNKVKLMSGNDLALIWKSSKLSMNQFGVAIGLGENNGTRIRDMIAGTRPVSPKVEAGAMKLTGR